MKSLAKGMSILSASPLSRINEIILIKIRYKNCVAEVGYGGSPNDDKNTLWMTVYKINELKKSQDQVKSFLLLLKEYCNKHDYDFGYSCAENTVMKHILYKLKIKEREAPVSMYKIKSEDD